MTSKDVKAAMEFLFVHQNFPGQFAHLAPALAARGHRVAALSSRFETARTWRGVRILPYRHEAPQDAGIHPWLGAMNRAVARGTAVHRACLALRERGLDPDAVVAHSGWGEAMFLDDVWPKARIGVFAEFYYRAEGADIDFDPEFRKGPEIGRVHRVEMKNLPLRLQLERAHRGISPTRWQADAHPPGLRERIDVIHDGVDTDAIRPDPEARLTIEGYGSWSRADEVVTFVNRNLEPYRGFHVFMRALPDLLRRRPQAQILIVGEDGVSYGAGPTGGGTWRETMTREVRARIPDADWSRVHFVGRLSREDFTRALQVARVHLYLTYPFVLSWSLLEAMSAGAAIVASDTAPVREVMRDGETGSTVDFFDTDGLVERACALLDDAELRGRLGQAARAHVVETYDLKRIALPAQFDWIRALCGR